MVSKTFHLNVPTTKYRYRLPIQSPGSPNPAVTDYLKMSIVAPKSGSTTTGTLSLRLEVRSPNIDRGSSAVFSLGQVTVTIIASGCVLVAGSQLPSNGTIIGPSISWKHVTLGNGTDLDYSVDFQWPFAGKRSIDFVVSADELERPGVIANVRVAIP